jgi:hypothetical protein
MSASPSGSYPIRLQIDYQEQHSRLTTFFRFLLVIPHQIIVSVLGIVMSVLVSVAWIVILITGRHPQGIHSTISQILRWNTRVNGYMYLLTDEYPPFNGDE